METGYFNRMELQLTRARPLRNILMELRLTLFEKMSGLRRAQIATRWTMRSGTRFSKGLCRETGHIHREQTKKTDSKVLERHYPRRNTKDNISLENVLTNSGGWKWWTYRSSCLKNCNGLMISHNLTVNFVRPAIHEVLITSYINRSQNCDLLYLVVFEVLIPKVWNVFIELQDIYIYIYITTFLHWRIRCRATYYCPIL